MVKIADQKKRYAEIRNSAAVYLRGALYEAFSAVYDRSSEEALTPHQQGRLKAIAERGARQFVRICRDYDRMHRKRAQRAAKAT